MAIHERRVDRAAARSQLIRRQVGADIRLRRRRAGLSIDDAAAAVGLSPSMLSRMERGVSTSTTIGQLCLACAAVGLRLSGRAFPDGPAVRDAAQAALLERFHRRLPAGVPWRTEVPMPIAGDLRGWDAMTVLQRTRIAIEAEMRFIDSQVLDREVALKRRDSGVSLVVLLIPDTLGNRRVLSAERESLRASFPLDTRGILRPMSAGLPPRASGIVVL